MCILFYEGLALCGVGYDIAELEIKKHNIQGCKKEKEKEEIKNVTKMQIGGKANEKQNQNTSPPTRKIFKVQHQTFLF